MNRQPIWCPNGECPHGVDRLQCRFCVTTGRARVAYAEAAAKAAVGSDVVAAAERVKRGIIAHSDAVILADAILSRPTSDADGWRGIESAPKELKVRPNSKTTQRNPRPGMASGEGG